MSLFIPSHVKNGTHSDGAGPSRPKVEIPAKLPLILPIPVHSWSQGTLCLLPSCLSNTVFLLLAFLACLPSTVSLWKVEMSLISVTSSRLVTRRYQWWRQGKNEKRGGGCKAWKKTSQCICSPGGNGHSLDSCLLDSALQSSTRNSACSIKVSFWKWYVGIECYLYFAFRKKKKIPCSWLCLFYCWTLWEHWSVSVCASMRRWEWTLYEQRKWGFSLAASLSPAASHRASCLNLLQGNLLSVF